MHKQKKLPFTFFKGLTIGIFIASIFTYYYQRPVQYPTPCHFRQTSYLKPFNFKTEARSELCIQVTDTRIERPAIHFLLADLSLLFLFIWLLILSYKHLKSDS